jgi:hypothetical protein
LGLLVSAGGAAVSTVSGAMASPWMMVQGYLAGVVSTLPAASVAMTWSSCDPNPSPL